MDRQNTKTVPKTVATTVQRVDRQNTKTVPKTVATTVQRVDRQNTKTGTAIQTERKKEHRATKEVMEGPTSSGG
jgi:hypothetical protein